MRLEPGDIRVRSRVMSWHIAREHHGSRSTWRECFTLSTLPHWTSRIGVGQRSGHFARNAALHRSPLLATESDPIRGLPIIGFCLMDDIMVHVLFEEHFQLAASKLSRYGRPESVAYRQSDIPTSCINVITTWSACMALFIGTARCEVRLTALLHSEDQNTSVT